jgi:methionyl-tRNA formyltransferase
MNIVFIGGVKFSYELLSHILNNGWSISMVFSYNESKKKFYSDYTSFEEITKKFCIPHVKVNNINDPENVNLLKKINPDLILVMGWSQLLKIDILQIPKFGVIGSHPTELPKYRGRAPLPWTILKNLKESALTFFYIEEGIDDGGILDQQKFRISQNDDATSLYTQIIKIGKKMILENLLMIKNGTTKKVIQNPKNFIENWPKRTPSDGKIHWYKSAKEIHTLIRATTHPYPGAFTFIEHEKLIIWKSSYSAEKSLGIGKIMDVSSDSITIGTGNNCLIIKKKNLDIQNQNLLNKIFSSDNIGKVLK